MTQRERLERKLERRREWAEKAENRSRQHWETGSKMFDAIPFGQPILVGHHSEKRDRAYRGRAAGHLDKGAELGRLAEHHEAKADGLENALERSIYSDDANAIEALEQRIAEHEAERAHKVLINRLYRAGNAAALAEHGISLEVLKAKLEAAGPYWGKQPHMPYELSNLGGRITADRKRLEDIKRRQARHTEAEAAPNGVLLKVSTAYPEYCSVTFAEKPEREVLDALKAAGFHWGAGSWGGKTAALPAAVRELLGTAAPATSTEEVQS